MATYTQVGEEYVTDLLDVQTLHIGMGTGVLSDVKGDTALTTEVESRVSTTNSQPASDQNQFLALVPATATRAIIEAGVFDAASVGNMILCGAFATINLANGDKIEFTFTLQHS